MSLMTFDFIVFRIVLPLSLLCGMLIYFNHVFPYFSDNQQKQFLFFCLLTFIVLMSTLKERRLFKAQYCLFILSHLTLHFVLILTPESYTNQFTNCSKLSNLTTQIGVQKLTGLLSRRIARMVIPDPLMLTISILILVYYIRKGKISTTRDSSPIQVKENKSKKKNVDERTEIWKAWAVENLCMFNSVLILCFSAIISPSILSSVYLLFFLGICTFWACHQKVDSTKFAYVRLFLLFYSACHCCLYYLYQFDFFQNILPAGSLYARILGLYHIYQNKCSTPGELFIEFKNYKEIIAPFMTLLLYYTMAIETRRWLDMPKERNALKILISSKLTKSKRDGNRSSTAQEEVMLIPAERDRDTVTTQLDFNNYGDVVGDEDGPQMHYSNTLKQNNNDNTHHHEEIDVYHSIELKGSQVSVNEFVNSSTNNNKIKNRNSKMIVKSTGDQSTGGIITTPRSTTSKRGVERRNSTIDFRRAFNSGIFHPDHLFPFYDLPKSQLMSRPFMLSVWYSCVRNSYATSFCAMMAWSVTFRNWFTFVLIFLACILWLLPNSRRAVLYCSPLIVTYSIILIVYQFIVCFDLRETEIPRTHQDYKLDDFGLEIVQVPFFALITQVFFLCIFWLTLKLFMTEVMNKSHSISFESNPSPNPTATMSISGNSICHENPFITSSSPDSIISTGSLSLNDKKENKANEVLKPTWLGYTSGFSDTDHPMFTWLSCAVHTFCVEYWLAFCSLMLLIVSVLLPVVIFRIVYMLMFIYFLLVYQLSYKIWRRQMLFFWWMCIIYSIVVLLAVYTYHFKGFKAVWLNAFNLTQNQAEQIGLPDSGSSALFTRLLTPSVFIVSMILQVHYFHKEFMEITNPNYDPRKSELFNRNPPILENQTGNESEFTAYMHGTMLKTKYKLIRTYYGLKDPLWRFLEVHWIKFLTIYTMAIITSDVSAINMVPLILILICLPFPYLHSACCSILFLFSGIQTTSQMVLQLLDIKTSLNCSLSATANNTYNRKIDPLVLLSWLGLKKEQDYSGCITKMLLLMLGSVFYHVILYRQRWYHIRPFDTPEGIIFRNVTADTVGKKMLRVIKFAFNYAFYKCGLEASYCVIVISATSRSDAISLIYLFFAIIFLFSNRQFVSRLWPLYLFILAVMLPIQYAGCIGLPPLCLRYPWDTNDEITEKLLEWLYLPTSKKSPEARKLMADFFQFLFVTMQYRIFKLEKDPKYGGGCNKPVTINVAPRNADKDFISTKESYIDYIMHAVFYWSYWLSLAIILLTGVMWITLFCFGYMVVAFVFMWMGQNILYRRRRKLLISWNLVLAYNFIVIFLKCSFQLLGCVFRKNLSSNVYCLVFQIFGVQCLNPMSWNKYEIAHVTDESCIVVESGLHLDVFCFIVILFQRKIFTMASFSSVVFDLGIQRSFASWGANFINKMLMERIRQQDKDEEKLFKKLQNKIDRIYLRFDKTTNEKKRINEHYMILRSGDYNQFCEYPEDEDETFVHDLDIPPIKKAYINKLNEPDPKKKTAEMTNQSNRNRLEPAMTIDNHLFDKFARSVNEDERQMQKVIDNFTVPFELNNGYEKGIKKGHRRLHSEPNGKEIFKDSTYSDGFNSTGKTSSVQSTSDQCTENTTPAHRPSTLLPDNNTIELVVGNESKLNMTLTDGKANHHRRTASFGPQISDSLSSSAVTSGACSPKNMSPTKLRIDTTLKSDRSTFKSQSFSPNIQSDQTVRINASYEFSTNLWETASTPSKDHKKDISTLILDPQNIDTKMIDNVDEDDPEIGPEPKELIEKLYEKGTRKTISDYKMGFLSSHHQSNSSIHISGQPTPSSSKPRNVTDDDENPSIMSGNRKSKHYLPKQVSSITEDNEDVKVLDPLKDAAQTLYLDQNKKEVHFDEEKSPVDEDSPENPTNETLWTRIRNYMELIKILFVSAIKAFVRKMNAYTKDYRCMRKYLDEHKRICKRKLLEHSFESSGNNHDTVEIPDFDPEPNVGNPPLDQESNEILPNNLADDSKGQEFMRSRSLLFLFFMAMGNLAVYYSDSICYVIMIANTIQNPSLLTLTFPLMVFLWALLCVPRPSKTFWIFVITYTEIMIIVKYIFQFKFFEFNDPISIKSNHPYWWPRLVGIDKRSDYVTFDLVQLIIVFLHRAYLKTNGLWRDNEETEEDLQKAAKSNKSRSATLEMENVENLHENSTRSIESNNRSWISKLLHKLNIPSKIRNFYLKMTNPKYNIKVDVYKYMFLCEFISFVIIIFGYNGFSYSTGIDDLNAFEFLKTNKIPLPFFLTGVTQSIFIIIDRGLFLRKNVLGKFIFQIFHVLLIHSWLFIILPYMTMTRFVNNKIPMILYIIKCVYFALSAYQIRSNYPKRILGNFLTKNFDYINLVLFKVYMNIPFLYELRSVMDWMWTRSTFSLYHWMQFEDIYAKLFVNKCWRRSECNYPTPRGKNRRAIIKGYVGGQIVCYFLLCLWAPIFLMLLLESTFVVNVPYSCQISYSINGFSPLYRYTARSENMKRFTLEQREDLLKCFETNRRISAFIRKFQSDDIVHLIPFEVTDDYWTISAPALDRLKKKFSCNTNETNVFLNFLISCQRTHRETDSTILTVEQNLTRAITSEESCQLSKILNKKNNDSLIDDNVQSVDFHHAFPRFILAGNGFLNIPFIHEKSLLGNITAFRHASEDEDGRAVSYWEVKQRQRDDQQKLFCPKAISNRTGHSRLDILVFNQRIYDNPIAKYISSKGIIGIYAAYIFFAHRMLRMLFHNLSYNIRLEELPYLDRVLNMCHEVYLVREFQELRLEEQLYSRLMFLYRSSELMIKWTRHPKYLIENFTDPPDPNSVDINMGQIQTDDSMDPLTFDSQGIRFRKN